MSVKDINLNIVITSLIDLEEKTIEDIASIDEDTLSRLINCYTRYFIKNRIPYKVDYVRVK